MEFPIINIINKSVKKYQTLFSLSRSQQERYLKMLYIGAQVYLNKRTMAEVSQDTDYDYSYAYRVFKKWQALLDSEDAVVVDIIHEYDKLVARGYKPDSYVISEPKPALLRNETDHYATYLGMRVSVGEELMMQNAIRDAVIFMDTYGCGERKHDNEAECNKKEKWLTATSAVIYCSCNKSDLDEAAQEGLVERRKYQSGGNRVYYEYKLSDLKVFASQRAKEVKNKQMHHHDENGF